MKKKARMSGRGRVLAVFLVLAFLGLGAFAHTASAQSHITSIYPADETWNIPVNNHIWVYFDTSMDTGTVNIELEDEYGNEIDGICQWSTTTYSNDTLRFIPERPFWYGTHYEAWISGMTTGAEWAGGFTDFVTKSSTADATPPTVIGGSPPAGMTGVSTTVEIVCDFSEAMNPDTINSNTITLSGPGISGPGDYDVEYCFEEGAVDIEKVTPFDPNSTYTVTVTTAVRDLRGNPLEAPYAWSFTTGPADLTNPTVTQVIPEDEDTNVSTYPRIWAIFSEEMDTDTLIPGTTITLYDETDEDNVTINISGLYGDFVSVDPASGLEDGHDYTVTIGTGVTDRAGNPLSSEYSWSFTVAGVGVDQDPMIYWGANDDQQEATRYSDGSTFLYLEVYAGDDNHPTPLTVTASASGYTPWTLGAEEEQGSGWWYEYESSSDEGLAPGTHTLTFEIDDGVNDPVTFQRDVLVFDAVPTLSSPADSATDVSTTPTLQWSYTGTLRPLDYEVVVLDGPDPEVDQILWHAYIADDGTSTYAATIPVDKALAPHTTYYWAVHCYDLHEIGHAISQIRSFTTGGTPPPEPSMAFGWVSSRFHTGLGVMKTWLVAKVVGPSPADIAELNVVAPSGWTYRFTEDDILTDEQHGPIYRRLLELPYTLPDGTYTFTVTDRMGRTAQTNYVFNHNPTSVPSPAGMSPADGHYFNTTTPTFTWTDVGAYYRLEIVDWNQLKNAVYVSPFITEAEFTVPPGYLLPNTPYKWALEVWDAEWGSNCKLSTLRTFSTGPDPGNPAYDCDLMYRTVWNMNAYYAPVPLTILHATVKGPMPSDVDDLSVTGAGSYTFSESNVSYDITTEGSPYWYRAPGSPNTGIYNFYLEDDYANIDTDSTDLTSLATIPLADRATFSPANNAYIDTLTPTLSWDPVSGTPRYYGIMIFDWMERYTIYKSPPSSNPWATIPVGVLQPGMSYKWRVEVFDNDTPWEAENRSSSGFYCLTVKGVLKQEKLCPDGLDFGAITVGGSHTMSLIMNNTTDADIDVDLITEPSAPYSIPYDSCSVVTLHPGNTCTIRVQFAPTGAGTYIDSFQIPTNDPEAGTVTVSLVGSATGGSAEPRDADAHPSEPGASVEPDSRVSGSAGDVTVPSVKDPSPGGTAVSVHTPETPSVDAGTTRSSSAPIVISSLPPSSQRGSEKQLLLEESQKPLDSMVFGEVKVGVSDQLRIILSHDNGAAIKMGDIILPSAPYMIVEDKCSGTLLNTGGECAVTVQFSPPSQQSFQDYFLIPTNDPEVGTLRINLEGTGTPE